MVGDIKDIKPLVAIEDYSFYLLLFLIALAVLAIILVVYWFYANYKKDPKKEVLQQLHSMPLDDAKEDAYTITKLAKQLIVDDTMAQKYDALVMKLDRYKYKKDVDSFDEDTLMELRHFLGLADARV